MTAETVLYLVRHGITEANRRIIYAGQVNDALLPRGNSDLQQVAQYLLDKRVTSIMSSPQRRTYDSATPLAKLLNLGIRQDEDLSEMEMGPWTGLTDKEIAGRFPGEWYTWRRSPRDVTLRGFEGLQAVEKRAKRWLERVVASQGPVDGTAAVFTHETVIKVLVGLASGGGLIIYRNLVVPNASVSSLTFDGSDWQLRSLNEFVPEPDW